MDKYPFLARNRLCKDLTFDLLICDDGAAAWYGGERQEFTESIWIREHIKPGFRVVDCGSHHGNMTMIMALATGETGHVTAYDALPRNAEIVAINARLNGLSNVTIRPVGVGNSNSRMAVLENGGNSIVSAGAVNGQAMSIDTVRLDDDYRDRVDFLKLDVEGFEVQALEGAQRLLAQRPILLVELHNFMMPDPAAHVHAVLPLLPPNYSWRMSDDMWDELIELDPAKLIGLRNPHLFGLPYGMS